MITSNVVCSLYTNLCSVVMTRRACVHRTPQTRPTSGIFPLLRNGSATVASRSKWCRCFRRCPHNMVSAVETMQFCRLCLEKDEVNIPIFAEEDARQVLTKIKACLPIKVRDASADAICLLSGGCR